MPQSPVSPDEGRARGERAALLAACEAAATRWQKHLWGEEGEPARKYLTSRGVREEVARAFRQGYALPEWHELERALASAKIPVSIPAVGSVGLPSSWSPEPVRRERT